MNSILKDILLVFLLSPLCNLATDKFALLPHQPEKISRSLSKEIYIACEKNDSKAIKEICKKYGLDILNKSFTCSHKVYPEVPIGGYPIELLSDCKHWKLLNTLINNNIIINIHHSYYQNFLVRVAHTQDISKEKLLILDTLLKKNININDLNNKIPSTSSAFYYYVEKNLKKICYNDPIIAWFVENGIAIGGTRFYVLDQKFVCVNNIFHNIIKAAESDTDKAVTIAKTICSHLLISIKKNAHTFLLSLKYFFKKDNSLCFKLPKPLIEKIMSIVVLENINTKKIINALEQNIDNEKKPLAYFDTISLKNKDLTIFDNQKWQTNPFSQFTICNIK